MKEIIQLPEAQVDLGFSLMEALAKRRTIRKWQDTPISEQDLSNLLWAACGMTKSPNGKAKSKRTVPSACNSQEIVVYVLLEKGAYRYNDRSHQIELVNQEDIRAYVGTQKMMKSAPLGLVFVADLSRMISPILKSEEAKQFSAWVDTGFVSQNVYLYCAIANMATAVLALVKREPLHNKLGLNEHEKIVLTQVVGYKVNT